jgi:hypothetical protein
MEKLTGDDISLVSFPMISTYPPVIMLFRKSRMFGSLLLFKKNIKNYIKHYTHQFSAITL